MRPSHYERLQEMFSKVELFVTRKCQLDCSYCNIKLVNKRMPGELSVEEWKRAFAFFKRMGTSIVIVYGGEPLSLGDDLVELVRYLREIDLPYAIISNSIGFERYAQKLIDAGLRNWSASVDSMEPEQFHTDPYNKVRAVSSLRALRWFKEHGVSDVVACTTIHNQNLEHVPDLVRRLSREGIWCIATMIQGGLQADHDYASPKDSIKELLFTEKDVPRLEKVRSELIGLIKDGALLDWAVCPDYMRIWSNPLVRDFRWHCTRQPGMLKVDADGSIRCCTGRRGQIVPKYKVWELEDETKFDLILNDFQRDIALCVGCSWTAEWACEEMAKKDRVLFEKIARHEVTIGAWLNKYGA